MNDSKQTYPAFGSPTEFAEALGDLLQCGHRVQFTAPGHSMHPTIKQGDTLIVDPVKPEELSIGDIILYRHQERLFAHRLIRIERAPAAVNPSAAMQSAAAGPLPKHCRKEDAPETQRSHRFPDIETLRFVLRGDYRPNPDPPISAGQILGKVIAAERNGLRVDPCGWNPRLGACLYRLACRIKRYISFSR